MEKRYSQPMTPSKPHKPSRRGDSFHHKMRNTKTYTHEKTDYHTQENNLAGWWWLRSRTSRAAGCHRVALQFRHGADGVSPTGLARREVDMGNHVLWCRLCIEA